MKQFISDRYGQRYRLIIHEDSDDCFSAELRRKGERIGKVEARFNLPDSMVIEDIEIRNDFDQSDSMIMSIMQPVERMNYRRKGLGTALLGLAIESGGRHRVKWIYGSIVQKDISKTPGLLEFYEKRGFKRVNQYPDCLANALVCIGMELLRS
jgi:hypothetical protein